MKKNYFSLLLAGLIPLLANLTSAQSLNVSAYTTVVGSSTYQPTSISLTAAVPDNNNYDDGWYNNKPIGFIFQFQGVSYTTFSASTNGWLSLGRTLSVSSPINNLSTGSTAGARVLAPLWDDLAFDFDGDFYYETTGTAPNRVFTAEWYNASWDYDAGQGVMSFEVKLYENTNVIQYSYDRIPGSPVNNGSASIGLAGAAGDFVSVSSPNGTPTFSTTAANNTIGNKPADNLVLTFTPARVLYDFAAKQLPYTPLTSAAATRSGGDADDGYYNGVAIGFPFQFRGVSYTTISASTNGWLTFNQDITAAGAAAYTNALEDNTSAMALPSLLAPLWDDLDLTGGGFRTSVSGTAPARVFTAEWYDVRWGQAATAASLSFQVQLYEGTNRVWYRYAPTANGLVAPSASIGFNDGGYFRSLNGTGTAPTASTTAATDNLNTRPALGQIYAFAATGLVGGPLPVELLDFVAGRLSGTAVALAWHTASEKNNAGFFVEKSADGEGFREVGFVRGAGSTSSARAYTFTDAAAPAAAYYRLRQQDHDGALAYSPVQFVPAPAAAGKLEPLALYPNPAHGTVTVLNAAPDAALTLLDGLGRPVRTYRSGALPLDLSGLAPGLYMLRVADGGRTAARRLVVE